MVAFATADVFTPAFEPVPHITGSTGSNSPGSYAAATRMGMLGHSNTSVTEASLISSCQSNTPTTSLWPPKLYLAVQNPLKPACNPDGMAAAAVGLTSRPWVTHLYPDQINGLNDTINALKVYRSPAVIPIDGQADHWVAVVYVDATNTGGINWNVTRLKYYDGGPSAMGETDSNYNTYDANIVSCAGTKWLSDYFWTVDAINPSCNMSGCTSDKFYDHYLVTYEPTPGEHPPLSATFSKSPGVSPVMNEYLAQAYVWNSLIAARVHTDSEIWNSISRGTAGTAFHVDAVEASGAAWEYYLVPILSDANTAVAFVQLAADNGAFERIGVLREPARFSPVTTSKAEELARAVLMSGEILGRGVLTWNPRAITYMGKSPDNPYYEFAVLNSANPEKAIGMVRVRLRDGMVARGQ
jgi:hypothetical protein